MDLTSRLAEPSLFNTLNYINGRWQKAISGQTYPVVNPANGEIITEVANSDAIDAAHAATKRPFPAAIKLHETIADIAWQHKLIFRAFGDNILGFAPALCFTESDFDTLFERLQLTLDDVLALDVVQNEMQQEL